MKTINGVRFGQSTPIRIEMSVYHWDWLVNSLNLLEKDPRFKSRKGISAFADFTIFCIQKIFEAEANAFKKQVENPCEPYVLGITLFQWHWELIIQVLGLLENLDSDFSDTLHLLTNPIWMNILKIGDWVETKTMNTRGKVFYVGPDRCGVDFFHEDNENGSPSFATDFDVKYHEIRLITEIEEIQFNEALMENEKIISQCWPLFGSTERDQVEKLREEAYDLKTDNATCIEKIKEAAKIAFAS